MRDTISKTPIVLVGGSPETKNRQSLYQLATSYLIGYAQTDPVLDDAYQFENFNFSYANIEEYDVDRAVSFILETKPLCVGFSYYVFNAPLLLGIARRLKEMSPETIILFGGPNVSGAEKEKFLHRYDFVDFVISEEGEVAFSMFLHALLAREEAAKTGEDPFAAVQNLSYRKGDDVVSTAVGDRVDISQIPSPYINRMTQKVVYPDSTEPKESFLDEMFAVWETNRGCPYRCAFCYWGDGFDKMYKQDVDRVLQEVDVFMENQVKVIISADANFGVFKRDDDIARYLVESNRKHGKPLRMIYFEWAKALKPRHIGVAKMLTDEGIECPLVMAFQTLTREALDVARRKSFTFDQARSMIAEASTSDIPVLTHLILGLPGESYDEFKTSLSKSVDMGVAVALINPLQLLPGTEFYDDNDKFQMRTLSDMTLPFGEKTVIEHPKMTPEDQKEMVRISLIHYLHFNFKTAYFTNFYLKQVFGFEHWEVYEHMARYLQKEPPANLSEAAASIHRRLNAVIEEDVNSHGARSLFMDMLRALWTDWDAARELYLNFYLDYLPEVSEHVRNVLDTLPDGPTRLRDVVVFNLCIAPRPTVEPQEEVFEHEVAPYYEQAMRKWRVGDVEMPLLKAGTSTYTFNSPQPGFPNSEHTTHWSRHGELWIWKVREGRYPGDAAEAGEAVPAMAEANS